MLTRLEELIDVKETPNVMGKRREEDENKENTNRPNTAGNKQQSNI